MYAISSREDRGKPTTVNLRQGSFFVRQVLRDSTPIFEPRRDFQFTDFAIPAGDSLLAQSPIQVIAKKIKEGVPKMPADHISRTGVYYALKLDKDVRIPMRDGAYVVADVFRPETDGRFPIIMTM